MITDRVLEIIELKGLNKSKFYKETGLSNGFLDKVKDIGGSKIEQILNVYPEISPKWLITGKGEMLLKDDLNIVSEPQIGYGSKNLRIPVLEPEAVGGTGGSAFSFEAKDVTDYYNVPVFNKRGADFIITLTGHSMEPSFMHGDKLACKTIKEDSFIEWNKPHVIATQDRGIILKRIRASENEDTLLMVSENEDYAPYEVLKDEITGIAIVIGLVRLE